MLTAVFDSGSRRSDALFWLLQALHAIAHRHMCGQDAHAQKIDNSKLLNGKMVFPRLTRAYKPNQCLLKLLYVTNLKRRKWSEGTENRRECSGASKAPLACPTLERSTCPTLERSAFLL